MDRTTILVTDGAQSYKKVVKDYEIPRWEKKITIKRGGKRYPNMHGEFHIQKINGYHSRLKSFLSKFKSVASRYLPGYLLLFDYCENNRHLSKDDMAKNILTAMSKIPNETTLEALEKQYVIPVSNGPETELWEIKVPQKEQAIYLDWLHKLPIKNICEKHDISRRKIYYIKDKVNKYNLHNKIINNAEKPKKKFYPTRPISERNWNIFILCYQDGWTYSEVGKRYGITRQAVHQIVNKISQRPESATVNKFERVYPEKSFAAETAEKRAARRRKIHTEFKLLHSDSFKLIETYSLLSQMNEVCPKTVESRLRNASRKKDVRYQWNPDRKNMSVREYRKYLDELYSRIYANFLEMNNSHPELTKGRILDSLASEYHYSKSHLEKIIREQSLEPASYPLQLEADTEKPAEYRPCRIRIYQMMQEKQQMYPHLQKRRLLRMISGELELSFRTVESYYYYHHHLMRQEQHQEQVKTAEVVQQ